MKRVMKKEDLAIELADRTGFYRKNTRELVNALADIVIEHFSTATFDEPSELHLAPGLVLVGTRKPEGKSIDPRDRSEVISPEKVIPSAIFKPSLRLKLYKKPKGYKKRSKRV